MTALATVVLAVIALLTYLGVNPSGDSGSDGRPAVNVTADPTPDSAESAPSLAPVSPPEGGVLVATHGECTVEAVRAVWGLGATTQLLISVSPSESGCAVMPDSLAAQAGASTLDLQLASEGTPPAVLLECARKGGPVVACNNDHEWEFVGDWAQPTPRDDTKCREAASQYTKNALAFDSGLRSALFPSDDGRLRCAVGSPSMTLNGSVRGIGGGELPTSR
ncbi:hypothetical protein [Microbacterium sp.]|uniref:hypothetical protein n=1 Tax=Microbacterium sp. TaxID=51671 RepID=UPI003A851A47